MWVRVCECPRVSESVRVRVRAGLYARVRGRARVCGGVYADVWGSCVFTCAFARGLMCVRLSVCARACACGARVSVHACVRVRVRVCFAVPSASIFAQVLRVHACVWSDCVCAPRGCVDAAFARRRPVVLISRPAAARPVAFGAIGRVMCAFGRR